MFTEVFELVGDDNERQPDRRIYRDDHRMHVVFEIFGVVI